MKFEYFEIASLFLQIRYPKIVNPVQGKTGNQPSIKTWCKDRNREFIEKNLPSGISFNSKL